MTVVPDPRPEARHVATREDWDQMLLEKAGPCRSCGSDRQIEMHHLINRSQRGDDVAGNLVPLCRDCHFALTNHTGGWEEVAHSIRHSLTPLELAYVKTKKSRAWLEKAYPTGGVVLCAKCKRPVKQPREMEEPRKRKRWIVTVPDDAEDGADVLDTLVQAHRERLCEQLGWSDEVQPYFVVVAVLSEGL